jgi:hypothetical protein
VNGANELNPLLEGLRRMQEDDGWDFVELRPLMPIESIS